MINSCDINIKMEENKIKFITKITVAVIMDINYCKLWHYTLWMTFSNNQFFGKFCWRGLHTSFLWGGFGWHWSDSGMIQQSHNNEVIVCEQFLGKHQPVGLLLNSEYLWKYAMFWELWWSWKPCSPALKLLLEFFQLCFSIFTSTRFKNINFKILLLKVFEK